MTAGCLKKDMYNTFKPFHNVENVKNIIILFIFIFILNKFWVSLTFYDAFFKNNERKWYNFFPLKCCHLTGITR